MIRSIPVCLVLATLVMSGPVDAARTSPEAAQAASPKPVTPADVKSLLGTWTVPLETPNGRVVANVAFRVENGKVVAGISAAQLPEQKVTDITKAGQVVTLKASMDYQGPLADYAGPVTLVLTLRPKGQDLAAWFDFNNASYQVGGTATKKS
jgi:hypothetical protein